MQCVYALTASPETTVAAGDRAESASPCHYHVNEQVTGAANVNIDPEVEKIKQFTQCGIK